MGFSVGQTVIANHQVITHFMGNDIIDAYEGDKGEIIETNVHGINDYYNVRFPNGVTLVHEEEISHVH
jgi:hypothetical protein